MKIELRKEGDFITPHNEKDKDILDGLNDGVYIVDLKNMDTRSLAQNNALHKLFDLTAIALNDAGYSVNTVLNRKRHDIIKEVFEWGMERVDAIVLKKMRDRILANESTDLPWTMLHVKNILWREIQIHLTQKESTTKLDKQEIDSVYEVYNQVLSRYGINVPFPSKELWEKKDD